MAIGAFSLSLSADYDEGLQWLQKSLAVKEQALGVAHPDVSRLLNRLGTLYVEKVRHTPLSTSPPPPIWEGLPGQHGCDVGSRDCHLSLSLSACTCTPPWHLFTVRVAVRV